MPLLWPVAMFLSVWVLYAGDRLLDARGGVGLEERHRFHGEHRWGFAAGMLVCGAGLAAISPWLVLPVGFVALGGALLVWLGVVHLHRGRALPKELVVGGFFAAAVFLPVPGHPVAALGFAVLCALNCLYIHAWEHPYSSARDTHAWTLWGLRHLGWLTAGLVACALLARTPVMLAEGAAAGLLWGLHQRRAALGRTALRAAADAVLLTPLLALPWLR